MFHNIFCFSHKDLQFSTGTDGPCLYYSHVSVPETSIHFTLVLEYETKLL